MKTLKLMMRALGATVLTALGFFGCEEMDIYSIDAPADLQDRIDSIAAAKPDTGDTTYIDIATTIVGAEDNSSAFWTVWSDYFEIPINKRLVLEFINYGSGADDWNNWVVVTSNGKRDSTGYSEHFAFRADAEGWSAGNNNFNSALISHNLPVDDPAVLNESPAELAEFLDIMDGAFVKLEIDFSVTGIIFLEAKSIGTNGEEIVVSYNQTSDLGDGIPDEINAFLVCDGSHFVMHKAYLLPSQVTEVEDADPASIEITGAPDLVEIGSDDFWGNATATVTFADGSSEQADTADLSFNVIPDMTTVGEKTILVAYNKTKQGELTQAVSTFYNLQVINAVASLEVTTMPDVTTYTFPGPAAPVFDPTGMEVTATYSDGTTGVIANENLQFEIPGADGAQEAIVSYVGATATVTTTVPITNVMGGTNQVGASDLSTPFWTEFSNEYHVAPGASRTFKMDLYSTGAENWHSPVVILRKADLTEYAVFRMDNFGWGDSYGAVTATHDWDFDVFAENLDESYVEITVTNLGDNTANVRYDVTYANGDKHFQLYEGIPVDSSNLNCAITLEASYVDITSVE